MRRRILQRGIGRVLDDTQRDLGVRVTGLVQRAACECRDAWRCGELPASALALPVNILVELHQIIYRQQAYKAAYEITFPRD